MVAGCLVNLAGGLALAVLGAWAVLRPDPLWQRLVGAALAPLGLWRAWAGAAVLAGGLSRRRP
ncbi:MAG: hypothetical protein QM586_05725 [Xenophilus sp.]